MQTVPLPEFVHVPPNRRDVCSVKHAAAE